MARPPSLCEGSCSVGSQACGGKGLVWGYGLRGGGEVGSSLGAERHLSEGGVRELGPSPGMAVAQCSQARILVHSGRAQVHWQAGCTWHWCRRSRRPLVGFPQRTGPAPEEEGVAGPGWG